MLIDSLKKLTERIAQLLKSKVDKVPGKSLVSDTLITKLDTLTSVQSSEYLSDNKLKLTLSDQTTVITSNSIDLSSKVDKKVGYDLIKLTDIESIKGKVDKVSGKSLISDTLISKLQSIDMDSKVDKVSGQGLISTSLTSDLTSNWLALKSGINKYPVSVNISGADTKKIIFTLKDGTTIESQWVDLKGNSIDFNGAGFDKNTGSLRLNNSTSFTIDGRYRLLSTPITWSEVQGKPTIPTIPSWVGSSKPTYDWSEIQNRPAIPTIPSWIGNSKPTYNWSEIQGKPELNYLPLSGGTINPNQAGGWVEGIRINRASNNWATLTLGTTGTSGMTSDAWFLGRNPSGELQIQSTDSLPNTGMRLTNSLAYWKGNRILDMGWNTRNGKLAINTEYDNWLRINQDGSHPAGTYFGSSLVRTDNQIQVGDSGRYFTAQNGYTLLSNHLRISRWGSGSGVDGVTNTDYLQFGAERFLTFRRSGSYNWVGDFSMRLDTHTGYLELNNTNILRSNAISGYQIGSFNFINSSNHTNPIFTIGTDYRPNNYTLQDMYGIGYSNANNNNKFIGKYVGGWGMYVSANGNARVFLDGNYGNIVVDGGGFKILGKTNDEVLLAGGGTKKLWSWQVTNIDLRGADENKYFLVRCVVYSQDRVRTHIHTSLNNGRRVSWSTHDGGIAMQLELEFTGAGWGTIDSMIRTGRYVVNWSNADPVMNIGQDVNSSTQYLYLRGGILYTLYSMSVMGSDINWVCEKKVDGYYTPTYGNPLHNSMNWDSSKRVIGKDFYAEIHPQYGNVLTTRSNFRVGEIFLENFQDGSKTNIWSHGNELHLGSRNLGGYTRVVSSGYGIPGKTADDILVASGGTRKTIPYVNLNGLAVASQSNNEFRAGESPNSPDGPTVSWYHYFGGRHSNPDNRYLYNFAVPFFSDYTCFYLNNRVESTDKPWVKFIGFQDAGNNKIFQEYMNPDGYAWHYPSGKGFRVYSGNIGSGVEKLRIDDSGVYIQGKLFQPIDIPGGDISGNWTATTNWQNGVIFIQNPCNVELNQLQHMGSISFRKVFDGGNVTFSCSGKTIKYTGDTSFNGKDGSTAVVSIFNNKCYIDIRNI